MHNSLLLMFSRFHLNGRFLMLVRKSRKCAALSDPWNYNNSNRKYRDNVVFGSINRRAWRFNSGADEYALFRVAHSLAPPQFGGHKPVIRKPWLWETAVPLGWDGGHLGFMQMRSKKWTNRVCPDLISFSMQRSIYVPNFMLLPQSAVFCVLTAPLVELLRHKKWPHTALWGRSMKFGTYILLCILNDIRSGHTRLVHFGYI